MEGWGGEVCKGGRVELGEGQADDGGQRDMEAICSWPPLMGLRHQAIERH